MTLQKEGKENPALSVTAVWAERRDHDGNLRIPSFAALNEDQFKRSIEYRYNFQPRIMQTLVNAGVFAFREVSGRTNSWPL